MNEVLRAVRILGLAVFLGGGVAIAGILAPIVFKTLESREMAGQIVGRVLHVFEIVTLVSLGAALSASIALRFRGSPQLLSEAAIGLLLASTLFLMVFINPALAAARPQGTGPGTSFHRLHKTYEGVFGLEILIAGAALVLASRQRAAA